MGILGHDPVGDAGKVALIFGVEETGFLLSEFGCLLCFQYALPHTKFPPGPRQREASAASAPKWAFVRHAFIDSDYQAPPVAATSATQFKIICKAERQVGCAVHAVAGSLIG